MRRAIDGAPKHRRMPGRLSQFLAACRLEGGRALLREAGYDTVAPAALITAGIFAVVYGAYYLLSVQTCRSLYRPGAAS